MLDVERCPECNIPESFTQGQVWLNNGDIVQRVNPEARLGFIECENLDPLFANIGKIIGIPIERLVVNITARGTELYMNQLIPQQIKELVQAKQMDPVSFIETITTYCHIIGFGKYEFLDSRYERDADDFSRLRIIRPFSVPEAAGAIAGVASALVGGEHAVKYEQVQPRVYEFTTSWTEYPEVLKERLLIPPYRHSDGNIGLEGCATCGSPRVLRDYRWNLDQGIISNRKTARRMAVVGPELLDNLFRALEAELGETIPDVVVEAQRRFTRTGFYSIDEINNERVFRTQLALRGLGNLREMKIGRRGLHMRIDNAAGYLMAIGMVQGLFEVAFDVYSSVEWELSEDGDLEVAVSPLGVQVKLAV
jgi:hypothetical protein